MNRTKFIAVAVALSAASPAFAQVMSPQEYIRTAGASDLYERTSSQIVLRSTGNPEVREFAQMMIDHHTKSTADVTAAARRSGLAVPPPMLMPAQAEMIAQLRAEAGPARDAAYIAQQKASHNQALEVQKAFAMDGRPGPLRNAAAEIVPVVERHIAELKDM